MDTYPSDAWQRLGRLLERRRGELGYGFRQRAQFARDGGGRLSVKTISRLENGERASYPESTIGAVEVMYQWVPGSVEAVLRGGEPTPLSVAPPRGREPITMTNTPTTHGERLAAWIYVRMRQRGFTEDEVHEFLDDEGLPHEPTTVSAVGRIAEVTEASVAEVPADRPGRRPQCQVPEREPVNARPRYGRDRSSGISQSAGSGQLTGPRASIAPSGPRRSLRLRGETPARPRSRCGNRAAMPSRRPQSSSA